MQIKNTYKSKIIDKRLPGDVFYAAIDNYTHQTDTLSKTIHPRFVQFYFCIKGTVNFHFSTHYNKVLEEGNSFLIYQPEKDMPLQISVSAKSKLKIVVISVLELHQMFSSEVMAGLFKDSQTKVNEEQKLTPELHHIFTQLEQINVAPAIEEPFWKNKISELLLLYFSQKMELAGNCPFLENEQEAKAVRMAKEIILSQLRNGIKISDLAQQVQLSEYILKANFKKMYGKSITQFVLQHRMERGKEQIEKRVKKIKEIASELGYENPSHFIEAYKKYYGITPKQYEKKLG